jgi:hypothetical protein
MYTATFALGAVAVGGYFRQLYVRESAWHDAAKTALANPPPKPPAEPLLALTHWDPNLVEPTDPLSERLAVLRSPLFGYGFDNHPYSDAVVARAFDLHWRLFDLIGRSDTVGPELLRLQVELDQLAKRTLTLD